jgi:Cdc6-like AAA superfamily ATPase
MTLVSDWNALTATFLPQQLVVRQQESKQLFHKLSLGQCRLMLLGPTGCGKTVSVLKAIEQVKDSVVVYVNAAEDGTYTAVVKKILASAKRQPYEERGKTRAQLAQDLTKMLQTKRQKKLMFIIDEVDKLINKADNHQEVLFPLLNHANSSFVLISNDYNALKKLDSRLQSRLSPEITIFDRYSPHDLFHILKQRAETGLKAGSITKDVLISIGKITSDISGDVRYALKILEHSAKIAALKGKLKITAADVTEALKATETTEFDAIYLSLPLHARLTIAAIAKRAVESPDACAITYPQTYHTYCLLVERQHSIPLGQRRFEQILSDLAQTYDLISLSYKGAKTRRGRLVVAIPHFDPRQFLEKYWRQE